MLRSEKKTLRRFLAIYILLIITLITAVSIIYYNSYTERLKLEYKTLMQDYATLQTKRIKWLHNHFPKYNKYPRDDRYNSAIYDLEYNEIFSTLKSNKIDFTKTLYFTKDYVIYLTILSDYYLGAKYLFIEIPKNNELIYKLYKKIAIYSLVALIILLLLGYYLAKLFVKPMRDSINLLDNFIKDTTHEINTPISIINTNIEMVDESKLPAKEIRILKRVKIASRTLETIYKDLKFITLEKNKEFNNEKFNLKDLVNERLEYFALLIDSKKIKLEKNLKDFYIVANKDLIARLIDNLISNAIKYNKNGGFIKVEIKDNELTIEDSGIGIKEENLDKIFSRYSRFNSVEGGFGIGLNIVKQIADIYNLKIKFESKEGIGTKVRVLW